MFKNNLLKGIKQNQLRLQKAASNDPNRSKTITGGYIKGIIRNAFKKSDETVGEGTIHEKGARPEKFNKGKVKEK